MTEQHSKSSSSDSAKEATLIITEIQEGDPSRADELLPLVYDELRKLALHRLSKQPPGQTLQATALVHEAYLKVAKNSEAHWDGKGHFFAAAAESMRCIVIDRIRKKNARRHGGEMQRVDFDGLEVPEQVEDDQLLQLHELLDQLEEADHEVAQLVKLRFFVGLTLSEAGEALGFSPRTAKRRWAYARAWLYQKMKIE